MNTKRVQTMEEERLNMLTHAIGFIFTCFASYLLLNKAFQEGIHLRFICYLIYCIGLLTLYLASTLYHSAKNSETKSRFKIFDHSAIYLLIAGTYTPIALLTMGGVWGQVICWVVWLIAAVGIVVKLYFTGRYSKISTATYVLMGWVIIIAIRPLMSCMVNPGLLWLLAGGIFYTFGAFLYQLKEMKYNHVLFHFCVLLGSLCHYIVIFNYTN